MRVQKFLILLFLMVVYQSGKSQVDSLDIGYVGLDTITPQPLTLADTSLVENNIIGSFQVDTINNTVINDVVYGNLNISFYIKDTSNFSEAIIEISTLTNDSENIIAEINASKSALISNGDLIGNSVNIQTPEFPFDVPIKISILIISPIGQEFRTLNAFVNP